MDPNIWGNFQVSISVPLNAHTSKTRTNSKQRYFWRALPTEGDTVPIPDAAL